MSLSPLVSFKSRFVTYLLNFPRIYERFTHTHMHTLEHKHTHTYIYICICVCTYIYLYINTHTSTYIYRVSARHARLWSRNGQ